MDRVTEHAWAVVNGKIRTGDTERKACQRHLDDLERQNTEKFPYYWDVEKANDLIDFAETLNIAEGFERQSLKLNGKSEYYFVKKNKGILVKKSWIICVVWCIILIMGNVSNSKTRKYVT